MSLLSLMSLCPLLKFGGGLSIKEFYQKKYVTLTSQVRLRALTSTSWAVLSE